MIKVIVEKPRPDFRVFIDLLFGYQRNVDSEGDASKVYSRDWQDLYLRDRESKEPPVEIYSLTEIPLLFAVSSQSSRLEELAAIYLYLYCGTSIEVDDEVLPDITIKHLKSKYSEELKNAKHSIWHQSSEKNPYPSFLSVDKKTI
jgi:hypothetical protein